MCSLRGLLGILWHILYFDVGHRIRVNVQSGKYVSLAGGEAGVERRAAFDAAGRRTDLMLHSPVAVEASPQVGCGPLHLELIFNEIREVRCQQTKSNSSSMLL